MNLYRASGRNITGCKISVDMTSDDHTRQYVARCSIKDTDEVRNGTVNEILSMFDRGRLVFNKGNLIEVFNTKYVRSIKVEFSRDFNVW